VQTKIPVVLWFYVFHSNRQWNENTIYLNNDSRRFLHGSIREKKRLITVVIAFKKNKHQILAINYIAGK